MKRLDAKIADIWNRRCFMRLAVPGLAALLALQGGAAPAADELRIGSFAIDASPPVGTPLAYDPTEGIETPLECKGVVITGSADPIVICALDWIGIGNAGHSDFRAALAEAVGTTPERVAVHAVHQHDAPTCDFTVAERLQEQGIDPSEHYFDVDFARDVIARAADAAAHAKADTRSVTHVGFGEALVREIASNRRILGEDGRVRATRYTATREPEIRAEPAGTIDPMLKSVIFYQNDEPVVALTYYACHPQSYYRTGLANPDFPGLARHARQETTGVPHLHFDGAGGNIGAGKWNDGDPENRPRLAARLEDGMKRAWENTDRVPITADDVDWKSIPVRLPAGDHLVEEELTSILEDESAPVDQRIRAARHLIWLERVQAGDTIDLSRLAVGPVRLLHLPGELFVEYQLAAQAMAPEHFVAMAAYGDYAPGYIGTAEAYYQGGYEASDRASRVGPTAQRPLLEAIEKLLKSPEINQ